MQVLHSSPSGTHLLTPFFTSIHQTGQNTGNSTAQSLQGPPGLPPKPISQQEENKKKNFYPVSWRVIGGGVLMGGAHRTHGQFTSDSPFTSALYRSPGSSTSQDGSGERYALAEGGYAENQSSDNSGPVDSSYAYASPLPAAPKAPSRAKPPKHGRSNSIPTTSTTTHLRVESVRFPFPIYRIIITNVCTLQLFSAESPGSL